MLHIAHFIPPKSNQRGKNSRPLWRLRSFEEVHLQKPEQVTNKKTGCTHVNWNWKSFIGLFSLHLISWYFLPFTRCKFRNNNYASKLVIRRFCHIFHGYTDKTYISAFQHSLSPSAIKLRRKSVDLPLKSLFLDVETAFRHTFPSSDQQCFPPGDPRVLCAEHGIRLLANHSLRHFSFSHKNHVLNFQCNEKPTRVTSFMSKSTLFYYPDVSQFSVLLFSCTFSENPGQSRASIL